VVISETGTTTIISLKINSTKSHNKPFSRFLQWRMFCGIFPKTK